MNDNIQNNDIIENNNYFLKFIFEVIFEEFILFSYIFYDGFITFGSSFSIILYILLNIFAKKEDIDKVFIFEYIGIAGSIGLIYYAFIIITLETNKDLKSYYINKVK